MEKLAFLAGNYIFRKPGSIGSGYGSDALHKMWCYDQQALLRKSRLELVECRYASNFL